MKSYFAKRRMIRAGSILFLTVAIPCVFSALGAGRIAVRVAVPGVGVATPVQPPVSPVQPPANSAQPVQPPLAGEPPVNPVTPPLKPETAAVGPVTPPPQVRDDQPANGVQPTVGGTRQASASSPAHTTTSGQNTVGGVPTVHTPGPGYYNSAGVYVQPRTTD
jgi:hypothetical protein